MPDFQGHDRITLQPNDADVLYTFDITTCSSATANDGALPFGTVISSVTVKIYTSAGTEDPDIKQSSSELNDVVTIVMKYPTTNGKGRYKATFICTLNTSTIIEFDFDRIYAKDK